MGKKKIELSSAIYLGLAALSIIYSYMFTNVLYFNASSSYFNILLGFYKMVAQPTLYFSISAYIAIVIYVLSPIVLKPSYRKCILYVSKTFLTAYLIIIFLNILGMLNFLFCSFLLTFSYKMIFALLGAFFAIGRYEK